MSNSKAKNLLIKADSEFEKLFSLTEANVLRGYKKALKDIQYEISKALENTGQYPTLTELRKFNRLSKLENEITKIIADMQRPIINSINQAKKNSLTASYEATTFAIQSAYKDISLSFGILPKESIDFVMTDNLWLDALKNHHAKLLTDTKLTLETALRTNAREDIASGLAQGKSYQQIAKGIREKFNVTATRAKTITFTEMHKGHSTGRNEGIKSAIDSAEKLGLKSNKVWKHNGVGKPRPKHLALDGTPADKNGLFHIGSLKAEAPGLFGDPAEDTNCHCSAVFQLEGINQGI
jgi:hypothetical protein